MRRIIESGQYTDRAGALQPDRCAARTTLKDVERRVGPFSAPAEGSGRCRQRHGRADTAPAFCAISARTSSSCSPISTAPSRIITRTRPCPKTMQFLVDRVASEKADLGVAYDGDADRLGVVDENGQHPLGRSAPDPVLARGAEQASRLEHHLRGEVLAVAGRRRRQARRRSDHVAHRPLADQGEDEGSRRRRWRAR